MTKYKNKLKLSRLDLDDRSYTPLYKSKEYEEAERETSKFLAKTNWYKRNKEKKDENEAQKWKEDLQGFWRGSNVNQR